MLNNHILKLKDLHLVDFSSNPTIWKMITPTIYCNCVSRGRTDWHKLHNHASNLHSWPSWNLTKCQHVLIKQVQEDMRNGEVALEKYIITKSLTKPPEAYPDKNQPHVQVS